MIEIKTASDLAVAIWEKLQKGDFEIMEINVTFKNHTNKIVESNAVTSETGTAAKVASNSPSGISAALNL